MDQNQIFKGEHITGRFLSNKPSSIRYALLLLLIACIFSMIVLLYNHFIMRIPLFSLILSMFEIILQIVVILCIYNGYNTGRVILLLMAPILIYYLFFIPSLLSYSIIVSLFLLISYILRLIPVSLVFIKESNKWFREFVH